MRKFNFIENDTVLVLPVTPPSFEISHGINVETINIHTVGDVVIPGYGTLASISINCMFPARNYSFSVENINHSGKAMVFNEPKPYNYIKKIKKWCDNHTVLRFVIHDTDVNMQVIISDFTYGEKDGTGDVYATINLREYRMLKVGRSRVVTKSKSLCKNYLIKRGDTLSAICRKFYGKASLYPKLAKYNKIKNPNLIYAGRTLKIPDKELL